MNEVAWHTLQLRKELEQVQAELAGIKVKLASLRHEGRHSRAPRLVHVFQGWVPKVQWSR